MENRPLKEVSSYETPGSSKMKASSSKSNSPYRPYTLQSRPFYSDYKKSLSNYNREPSENNTNFLKNEKYVEKALAIPKTDDQSEVAQNFRNKNKGLHVLEKGDIHAPINTDLIEEGRSMMREIGLTDDHATINPLNWFTPDMKQLERRIQFAGQMGWMLVSFERTAMAKLHNYRQTTMNEIKEQTCESEKSILQREQEEEMKNVERAGKNLFRFRFR